MQTISGGGPAGKVRQGTPLRPALKTRFDRVLRRRILIPTLLDHGIRSR